VVSWITGKENRAQKVIAKEREDSRRDLRERDGLRREQRHERRELTQGLEALKEKHEQEQTNLREAIMQDIGHDDVLREALRSAERERSDRDGQQDDREQDSGREAETSRDAPEVARPDDRGPKLER
jgi:hypothetical protein